MKKAVAARARRPKTSHPIVEPAAEKPVLVNVGPPVKKLKSPALAPKSLGGRRAAKERERGPSPMVHKGPLSGQGPGA
ncbi:hypothetical protein B296_00016227 [Ensete ventricosum]|uniref:Uncharacterized protein n=1 Tax=Ensete ventricosum TaxID=4639 RepID=A0A426Z8H9_ENSVE|nr:hypothetical protein B296_00016227 [Ensete ventricosum]